MKKVTKKIKAVKPRSQADCKAFKARIAAAALPQSAWYSVITQVPAHALLLPASRSFKADPAPNRGFLRVGVTVLLPTIVPCAYQHPLTVPLPCRLILTRLAVGCTTAVASEYSGEFLDTFCGQKVSRLAGMEAKKAPAA